MIRTPSKRFAGLLGCAVGIACLAAPAVAAVTPVTVAAGALAGLRESGPADPRASLHLAIELQPRADLDALALRASDPASPEHRAPLDRAAFTERFGRLADGAALSAVLRANRASDVAVAAGGLVVRGILSVADAERLFRQRWVRYTDGTRTALAPRGPLSIPAAGVRDVRGAIAATTPRLADDRPSFTRFRGDWYEPQRFREMTDAIPNGGRGQRIVLIEDAADRFDLRDVAAFLAAAGAPPGADRARVSERSFAFKSPSSECGRDDRGQEPALDTDAALTMAPAAEVVVDYDDVCAPGDDGTFALAAALDLDPTVLVFPFTAGPDDPSLGARWGATPVPLLEAAVRGIPVVVPAGDDGAYGFRERGIERARVAWPCVSTFVVCAGGTQLGDRDGIVDEAPWNDLDVATGGGISPEPRPAWQSAPGDFIFSLQFVKNRIVPDVAADAGGHLRVYWHGYGLGGVGGTSESAALVAAELAAVNGAVAPARRLLGDADLYALARRAPAAFRDVLRENDRGWKDNTLRPRPSPLPKDYRGVLPSPPPLVAGCAGVQNSGCSVTQGFDAVTGLGDLLEQHAVDALR